MKQLVFRDMRRVPAGCDPAELELRLVAAGSGLTFEDVCEMPDDEIADSLLDLTDQWIDGGDPEPLEEGGWTLKLSAPVSGIETVTIRKPRAGYRVRGSSPQGYPFTRKLLSRLIRDLTPRQIDQLTIGDVAAILGVAYPELSRGSLFRG